MNREALVNILIFMGLKHCGKSSIGRFIADREGSSFADLDSLVMDRARREGFASVRELYRTVGLSVFQEYELEALESFFDQGQGSGFVLSLGGGMADNQTAMDLTKSCGKMVYLRVREPVLLGRILHGGLPPFLQGDDPPELIFHRMYQRRDAVYSQYADFIVELPDRPLEENRGLVYSVLKEQGYVG